MQRDWRGEDGSMLVETLIAILILSVGLLAMAQVSVFSVMSSKSYGRDASKSTAFAHSKLDELQSLSFADTTTNTCQVFPFPADGAGLTAGGSIAPSDPVANYADYLDSSGVRTASGSALFTRQWQILDDDTNVKRIIVTVTSIRSYRNGIPPSTTLVTFKTP
jgi:Tfp pilus assembly protein PilV